MFLNRIFSTVLAPFQLFYWRMATPQAEGAKVLIEHEGRYLLIREKIGQKHWTLPGGRQRKGESLADTARRKAMEEAGVELVSLTTIGSYFHTRQHKRDVISAYHTSIASPLYQINPNVIAEAGWFTLPEIRSLDRSESVDDVLELYEKQRMAK